MMNDGNNISAITGETEYDRFYQKWEKIIKSGISENTSTSTLNSFAVAMLPKDDPALQAVKRLENAVKEQAMLRNGFE